MADWKHGGFTLPGEAGYEKLTLQLAEKWGADVIRDSDGTKLSDEITKAGYRIYSTVCIIREHNEFALAHPECQQQKEKTAELFVRLAPGENPDFPNGHDDKTHFNAYGAERIAELIAGELRRLPACRTFFRPAGEKGNL